MADKKKKVHIEYEKQCGSALITERLKKRKQMKETSLETLDKKQKTVKRKKTFFFLVFNHRRL